MTVKLYDARNIDTLSWESFKDGEKARDFLQPLIKQGVQHYIDNIQTVMMALTVENLILPITINDSEYQNSFVCSMYGHYISYTLEALEKVNNKWIKYPLKYLVKGLGKCLKLGNVNKVVVVNNWLFSTNLYPEIETEQLQTIRNFLSKEFPSHAIVFKSIFSHRGNSLSQSLGNSGFNLIASRQVFLLNAQQPELFSSRIFKSDLKLYKESGYEEIDIETISETDLDRIISLYRTVYVDKHSKLNPQLNTHYIQMLMQNRFIKLKGLRKNGSYEAIAGYYYRDGVMMSPLLGYDTSKSLNEKLYRLTCTMLTLEAKKRGYVFHLSSGASFFKKIRKAQGVIEYNAVYHKHLPISRRLPWYILKGIINSIGVPFMRYYEG